MPGTNARGGKDGGSGPPDMTHTRLYFFCATALSLLVAGACPLAAAEVKGQVVDQSGAPIAGATVAAFDNTGVIARQITNDQGGFDFNVSPLFENVMLRVAANGFETATVAESSSIVRLALAPQADSVTVAASAIDVPAAMQGASVAEITGDDLRGRNEAQPVDLLRTTPGIVVMQDGARGSVADLFIRGNDPKYNLTLLNGVPINSFYYGGLVDFSQIVSDFIEDIQIARGPQSAVFGSYAMGGVINMITRSPDDGPALDFAAEGGTHDENRFSLSGSNMVHGWGLAASGTSLLANGPVLNSDYRNDNGFLSAQHRWRAQNLYAFGNFNSNDVGEPGPYGSNPKGYFSGLDRVSRSRNNTSVYGLHYSDELTPDLKLDVTAGFELNNSGYLSPYGFSFNKDIRLHGEARGTWHVLKNWTAAAGYSYSREEMRNTYVTVSNGSDFLLRRDTDGVYLDNQFSFAGKLFINAGLRGEFYQTPQVPANAYGYPPRPVFPASDISRVSPRISAAYMWRKDLRLHGSYGTGIRPPGGSDLAFTNNPALKPERIESYDIGLAKSFAASRLSLDATWFHNRYRDLIVSLGGSLSKLSSYSTDNVANAMGEGLEFSTIWRPAAWASITGNYMWLETDVLSLNGGNGLVQQYYYLGQPLLRRPKHSGSVVSTFRRGRFDSNVTAYFRGKDLDVEPNYGAYGGLYWTPGFVNLAINVNYRVKGNLTAYVNLRNALDRHYEEIYGYPAPLLNVVTGLKWSLARAR